MALIACRVPRLPQKRDIEATSGAKRDRFCHTALALCHLEGAPSELKDDQPSIEMPLHTQL